VQTMDLGNFNPEQKKVITLTPDPQEKKDILVIAGAGSGKTRVVVNRIAYLQENHNVDSREILAVTFTRKAAKEMQQRAAALSKGKRPVKVGTFHSIAVDLLRQFDNSGFDIIDDGDKRRIIKNIINEMKLKEAVELKRFLHWLGYQRNKGRDPAIGQFDDDPTVEIYREVAKEYAKAKSQIGAGVYDFDDLLEKAVLMLRKREDVAATLKRRWKYIFVDEYQDTNHVQFELLRLVRGKNTQMLMVGDEDQLIYSWRGAEIRHIMDSYEESKLQSDVECVTLFTNYRCSGNILELANHVVGVNSVRSGKKLEPHHVAGEPVKIFEFASCSEEAEAVAHQLERWHSAGTEYDSMAVLMRTNHMGKQLERAMINLGIPYHMHNGIALFDSREAKLILGLLRFTDEPHETFYLEQIMETIKMGMGPAKLKKAEIERIEKGLNWVEYFRSKPSLSSQQRIKELILFFDEAKEYVEAGNLSAAAKSWLHNWGLMDFYKEEEREKKAQNLLVLFSVLEDYEHQAKLKKVKPSVVDFQEQRLLNDTLTDKEKPGAVHLMTIHKAKGLEFERGVIIGIQDGVFPMNVDGGGGDDPEEDARLAYVAITRFMKSLWLTKADYRIGFRDVSYHSSLVDPHGYKLEKIGVVEYDR